MKKLLVLITLIVVTVGIVWAILAQSPTTNDKLSIVGSFYPMAYFASEITGDSANVVNITPANAEPHDYDPSTGDIANMERSKLIILNGVVEAWGDKVKTNFAGNGMQIITVGEGLFTRKLQEGATEGADPHVWLAPLLAKKEAQKIFKILLEIDPSHASLYQKNEQVLEAKFDQLDQSYRVGLSSCQRKDIVTSHAAFGYLAQAYGLNQVAIASLSPDEEPSPQQLASVASFVHDHGVKYIFFESLISPKLADNM